MIKPSELQDAPPKYTQAHMDELERQFDAAIRTAEASGKWPAKVPDYRDNMPEEAVEATAARYREVGWVVMIPSRGGSRAEIAKL